MVGSWKEEVLYAVSPYCSVILLYFISFVHVLIFLLFVRPLDNFSFIWRRDHCRSRAENGFFFSCQHNEDSPAIPGIPNARRTTCNELLHLILN